MVALAASAGVVRKAPISSVGFKNIRFPGCAGFIHRALV